ncbi:hypothetical protein H2199_004409 [Coniosporium tulheliwenetii]|uniref:Uncharacterized protein n=1 Tax=Coniosporium tulheliwenetii TaxID=3383036 RepID=A0ACC2Z6S8_9PEZI|nr:hypothetical protein H2199_004409 [Cladosporium sp. JES 115]
MASFVSFTDMVRGSKLAWEVYNLGWHQDLQASTQYNAFGEDVQNLKSNLDAIIDVVQNASQQTSRNERRRDANNWDLSSIKEIVGDYERTLNDSKQLLHENRQFSRGKNPLVNIEWNIVVMPTVTRLRERISFHNSKAYETEQISILLKPLEIKLLSAIRDDIADVHNDLTEQIGALRRELRGILVPNVDAAIAQQESQETSLLDIPPTFAAKFQEKASVGHPDFITSGKIPLQDGADALLRLFHRSTLEFKPGRYLRDKEPSPLQYLNLLKCVWLMQELRSSSEFNNVDANSHWPGYIKQLDEDLSKECQRFTSEQLIKPTPLTLQDLTPDDFCIWFEDEVPSILPPSHETVMLEEVLNVPFQPPSHQTIGRLRLLRADANRYQMIETAEDRIARIPRDDARKSYFNLSTVQLIPLYAAPGSQPDALTVMLRTDTSITSLTFQDLRHILKLQHVITGYKPYGYYDQSNVQVTASVSSIDTGSGIGLIHEKPLKPLLVMFLKSQDGRNKLSFLTIQIDDTTRINWERCDCRKGRNDCRIVAIERQSSALLAQRYESGQGSAGWNIAAVGRSQRKELPEFECKGLKRISLRFQGPKEREDFGGKMCRCNPQLQGEEKECIRIHQGIFGQVRQIGKQRLEKYHRARQQNSRQSIVIGPMLDRFGD